MCDPVDTLPSTHPVVPPAVFAVAFPFVSWLIAGAGLQRAPTGQRSMNAVQGIPAQGIALGYAAGPPPRATVPASVMAAATARQGGAGSGAAAAAAAAAQPSAKEDTGCWRLLSGHERGQVLVWQVKALTRYAAAQRVLHLVCVVGDPRPQW